ncbi:hypothetical protein Tco_1362523 [Tanacetum coccineum]
MSAGRSSPNSRGVDRKASGSSDNSKLWDVRETRKPFDTTHKVHEIPFNCKRKRMDKKIRKPQKQKKKKSSSKPVKQRRLLLGSHLLGFNEGYGDGLYPPCDVEIGRKQLIRSVKDILEGHHIPVIGRVNRVCYGWSGPLTVITVMLYESARFHPVCLLVYRKPHNKEIKG